MISVLVVEDDPVAADAHRMYVERVPGFEVVGVVHSGAEAFRALDRRSVDLLLLDFYLPDCHGLQLCRRLRAAGNLADVIAVTSARDLTTVRAAVSIGVVQYLLKPFTFATLRAKLERYAHFHATVAGSGNAADQQEVDRAIATLRSADRPALPKGMSASTLETVTAALRTAEEGLTAGAVAAATGLSRITARRYLEYLVDGGRAARTPRYGQVGRPELHYRWSPG
ncbi:response regulator [Actinoallomurus rhizosphaericola]|uniref:response regulator n=1 Tax=Actinoallomurus rhizosphaericola TaxID=2952536 RepID=UPI002093692C|nr:response regulator [Actinoallomurus rhizosphaericola]MCO5996385.1 response regulator [Actinoallomurus rhizosphaericola]